MVALRLLNQSIGLAHFQFSIVAMTMAATEATAALEAQLEATWGRWRRRSAAASAAASDALGLEAQFELMATGMAVSDDQARDMLLLTDSSDVGASPSAVRLLVPVPNGDAQEDALRFYHFKMVVTSSLIAQVVEDADEAEAASIASRVLGGALVGDVLLAILKRQRLALLHSTALGVLQMLVAKANNQNAALFERVHAILVDSTQSEPAVVVDDDPELSYDSLCAVLQLLIKLEHNSSSSVHDRMASTCRIAIASGAENPRFLRAATVHLAPALLKLQADESSMKKLTEELLCATVAAWKRLLVDLQSSSSSASTAKAAQGLLYVACLLVPYNPRLIADSDLQAMVALALTENDPLLRKQGLHILKVSFSHYVIQAEQRAAASEAEPAKPGVQANDSDKGKPKTRKKKKGKENAEPTAAVALPAWVTMWQQFITGSEVILMHHEQHLIEQVWPQVEILIQSSLVVMTSDRDVETSNASDDDDWPVRMSFAWARSLLVRVFNHDNAAVKRLFLSQLMERCVLSWDDWCTQHAVERDDRKHELVVDRSNSFACEEAFRDFVLVSVLRASNDPVLYKNSKRAAFQALLTKFLASFLRFRLEVEVYYPQSIGSANGDELHRFSLLDEYVSAMHDAIFGEDADAHSPEALQSIAQVFQDKELQLVVKRLTTSGSGSGSSKRSLLTAHAIEQLRFIMEVHVLPSFPYAVRVRMLNALSHALTRGFTDASSLSLMAIARILTVFPSSSLVANRGDALVHTIQWLQSFSGGSDGSGSLSSIASALQRYLRSGDAGMDAGDRGSTSGNEEDADGQLSAAQLARLVLFTATLASSVGVHNLVDNEDEAEGSASGITRRLEQRAMAYQTSLSTLLHSSRIDPTATNVRSLVTFVAAFEQQRLEVERDAIDDRNATNAPSITVSFPASHFYGASADDEVDNGDAFSCQRLFGIAERIATQWLENEKNATASPDAVDDNVSDFDAQVEMVTSATWVMTRMAVYIMEEGTDLSFMARLDAFCESLVSLLDHRNGTSSPSLRSRTLALQALAIVSSNAAALDALNAFQASRLAPLLVKMDMRSPTSSKSLSNAGMKQRAWCLRELAESKWLVMQNMLLASSFVPTATLRSVFDDCLESLSTAGMKPSALLHMVNVLSAALRRLAGPLVAASARGDADSDDEGVSLVSTLLRELWDAYGDCKSKPDSLTRAVVYCAFQPAFLLSPRLAKGPDNIMRQWVDKFLTFGRIYRPNVVFHVTCRLCQVWRANLSAARWFLDEIVELLLYKEPVIDEKEQLATSNASDVDCDENRVVDDSQLQETTALTANAKNRFVRLIVLSFLDELAIEAQVAGDDDEEDDDEEDERDAVRPGRRLLTTLLLRLLRLNVTPEWQKQHMLNSDGFGKKIRAWQALCVLGQRVATRSLVEKHVAPLLCETLPAPQLPGVRFYMEIFAMQLVAQFPRPVMNLCLLPLLRNFNLTPQVAATLLLVCGYAVHNALDRLVNGESNSEREMCAALLEAMLPWLNSSHGHTRVLAQYMLAELLPRYLPYEDGDVAATGGSAERLDVRFLRQLALYLSENKECKRMFRRQTQQIDKFLPPYEASLLGLLSSSYLNEFQELLPRDERLIFATQFRDALNELYAQYQREYHVEVQPMAVANIARSVEHSNDGGSDTTATALASMTLNVQRKIDTHPMLLLDDAALPTALQQQQLGHSSGGRLRQPVIMCASLVDKVPNLAGLARTCEIFNAQSLVVPSERVLQDETFASVSVTADKWMPIEEVRPDLDALLSALRMWKRDGYTIVAVEQTASSHCLSTFKFPKKMVVVLGKEREGVPVEVLQAVDACVEIPQFGVIRSLNVHVSGALLLWEYTQQHMTS